MAPAAMVEYLKQLAARLLRRGSLPFPPTLGEDPLGVQQPRHRRPGGNRSSAAVPEPVDEVFVEVRSNLTQRRRENARASS
jgi:hypothetical protein